MCSFVVAKNRDIDCIQAGEPSADRRDGELVVTVDRQVRRGDVFSRFRRVRIVSGEKCFPGPQVFEVTRSGFDRRRDGDTWKLGWEFGEQGRERRYETDPGDDRAGELPVMTRTSCVQATASGHPARVRAYTGAVTTSGSLAVGERGKVLLAKPRGYCAGVERAVQTVEQAIEKFGAPVYVRKQIVHNLSVVQNLEARGAIFVEETDEVPEGAIVIFSAHGVSPVVHEEAANRQLRTIDATCPLVTKVHHEARRFAREDYDIILIGHEGHEEVIGTTGQAPERMHLVDGPDEAASVVPRDPKRVAWLSQTTLSVDETLRTVDALRERFPNLTSPPSDDICYATQNRQNAVKAIADRADLVLVVGSRNSSNSVRLVEVALDEGVSAAYLVDHAEEIDAAWLDGVKTVGVTSGASAPEWLVDGVMAYLAEHGFDDVEEIATAQETLLFALPPEVRRRRGA